MCDDTVYSLGVGHYTYKSQLSYRPNVDAAMDILGGHPISP